MKKYNGLILDGPNDGEFVFHHNKYLKQSILPYSFADMPVDTVIRTSILKHVEYCFCDDQGDERQYGFWIPVDVTEPHQWIMGKLIRGYKPC